MNTTLICKNREKYANAIKAAREANKSLATLEGALSVFTKFWNNGFNVAAKEFGYVRPSDFTKAFKSGAKGAFNSVMFGTNAKGVRVLGIWKAVKVQDMAEDKSVIDANGRVTHPYVYDANGHVVTKDVWCEVKRWTPSLLFEVMAQSQYSDMVDAVEDQAKNEGIELARENVEYIAERAITKIRKANAVGTDLIPAVKTSDDAQTTNQKIA